MNRPAWPVLLMLVLVLAGIGLFLLVAGAATSFAWLGRLP